MEAEESYNYARNKFFPVHVRVYIGNTFNMFSGYFNKIYKRFLQRIHNGANRIGVQWIWDFISSFVGRHLCIAKHGYVGRHKSN